MILSKNNLNFICLYFRKLVQEESVARTKQPKTAEVEFIKLETKPRGNINLAF